MLHGLASFESQISRKIKEQCKAAKEGAIRSHGLKIKGVGHHCIA
jgi:hypothetical protein